MRFCSQELTVVLELMLGNVLTRSCKSKSITNDFCFKKSFFFWEKGLSFSVDLFLHLNWNKRLWYEVEAFLPLTRLQRGGIVRQLRQSVCKETSQIRFKNFQQTFNIHPKHLCYGDTSEQAKLFWKAFHISLKYKYFDTKNKNKTPSKPNPLCSHSMVCHGLTRPRHSMPSQTRAVGDRQR